MADQTFTAVLPPTKAVDNGDGTFSVAVHLADFGNELGQLTLDHLYFDRANPDAGMSRVAANIFGLDAGDSFRIPNDSQLQFGDTPDIVFAHRNAALAAADPLVGVFVGTALKLDLAARSLVISNLIANGDILMAVNYGGNSWTALFADASLGCVKIFTPGLVGITGEHDLDVISNASTTISSTSFVGADATKRATVLVFTGRGTKAAPTKTISGDILGDFGFEGLTDGNTQGSLGAYIRAIATEDWAAGGGNRGTSVGIYTTPNASGTQSRRWLVDQNGDLIGGSAYGVVIGGTTRQTIAGVSSLTQIMGVGNNPGSLALSRFDNTAYAFYILMAKSRGASVGSYTIVQNNDAIGEIYFNGANGTDLSKGAALIGAYVDGTPGANDMPGRLVFKTSPDGSTTLTERLRITHGGVLTTLGAAPSAVVAAGAAILGGGVAIGADALNNLIDDASGGTGSTPLYIGNAQITAVSDIRVKKNVSTWRGDALSLLRQAHIVQHEWNDPTDRNPWGKNSRGPYVGMVAQETVKWAPWAINAGAGRDCPACLAGAPCSEHSMWQAEYEHLVPLLVKAIQEIDANLTAQRT
jgi:hypothetical protein